MTDGVTFGRWLRRKREAAGLTQEHLADAAQIRRPYLNRIENDYVHRPTLELRQRLHDALGTSEDELIALGIVRGPAVRPEPLRKVGEASPSYAADAFIASLSPDQRALLRRLLDEADRPHPEDADDAGSRPDPRQTKFDAPRQRQS